MHGLPVTIRLLDPPLHEFLPHGDKELNALAREMKVSVKKLQDRVKMLHEFNPMLGHRGCRLGIIYPEIYDMQVQAIMEAACDLSKEGLIISEHGRKGGFRFQKAPKDIYLAEIVDAVEGLDIMTKCIVGFEECPFDNQCAMHESWLDIRKNILKVLETTSLEDFVKEHKK